MKEFKAVLENGELKVYVTEGLSAMIIARAAEAGAIEKAKQDALEKVYNVSGLVKRMNLSKATIYDLLASGELRKKNAAKKGYQVTELAVRQYYGDITD